HHQLVPDAVGQTYGTQYRAGYGARYRHVVWQASEHGRRDFWPCRAIDPGGIEDLGDWPGHGSSAGIVQEPVRAIAALR
ncbi:hypothetical protein ABTO47_19950, partial [Acinetobacter baumannii]